MENTAHSDASTPPLHTTQPPRDFVSDPPPQPTMQAYSPATNEITRGGSNPLNDLKPDRVPPELKKVGSDWWAIFNPNVPRVLDVNLNLTLIHESVVCCVRFSPDGKYLATGAKRTTQIYDVKTGAIRCVLEDEGASKTDDLYIRSVCFSPDGKYLATALEDKKIRVWDIAKREIRIAFEGHTDDIYSLDFSRDGKFIVSGSADRTARIWDVATGTCKTLAITEPETTDACLTSVAISPDGRFVAAGSLDMLVRIWDIASGALVERLKGHKDSVYSVAFHPDGRGLVSGSLDKSLKYWDITSVLKEPTQTVVGLSESSTVASNSVPIVGAEEGGEMGSTCAVAFTGHTDYVLTVAVSPDGAWVASGSKDTGVQFWNPADAQAQVILHGHKNSVISIDLSPTGGVLASGSGDWFVRVWSYTTINQS
ncbi:hypothetical protein BS47DRAFT_1318798 [Hydnum rufescens UP504]|uniref:WD40 repeat-like protein n=1 Tax=Hydnum rufescens UP504 TaxID=1448309 RepID=A0A9P6ATK8_9AGAM|nr:hypothetical protein BS47DRAFT_1318798 [Hydnum rufescens UP504]